MQSEYMEIGIEEIELDYDNPRIARILQIYERSQITSQALALALGGGAGNSDTTYGSLKESIRSNKGIIHPIIVNRMANNKYIVIEGNTRVQIYREFRINNVEGDWDKIRAIVYDELAEEQIHAIRLQSHLVGPRDWDAYSKAKYLNYLSNEERLPLNQIVSFCGGKSNEVRKMIDAYNDMEKYYRKSLDSESEFDVRKFSAFVELQNRAMTEALFNHKYTKEDYAKWVINGNIDTMQNVRKIPKILKSKEAMNVFLNKNVAEAEKVLAIEEISCDTLKDVPYEMLAMELTRQLKEIKHTEIKSLKYDLDYDDKKQKLYDALDELKFIVGEIEED